MNASSPHARLVRRTRARRKGAMLILVAVLTAAVLAMVAFAVDIGYVVTVRTQLQSAADSAALAGASTLMEAYSLNQVQNEALNYAQTNAPGSHASVTLGVWDPDTKTFTADNQEPNAVRVVVERAAGHGNAVPLFFARIFGQQHTDLGAESIAVGAIPMVDGSSTTSSVYVTSTKDLSNVVLKFEDGTRQKFDGLSGYSGTFSGTGDNAGKTIVGVWIKSGCYKSGEGPGYGEYIADPGTGATVHGNIAAKGCYAHVTATFSATGVTFAESGSAGPVRLVK
jgi:hypothetical protein